MTRNKILLKIQYAENFTPHKIEYYREMLKNFDNITIQVGTFEGFPIERTITAQEIREAQKYGISKTDLIDLEKSTYRDWQADC